jgi:hypothetical protein
LLALGCGFTRKNFRNRIQWRLDPQECLTEVNEDGGMEYTVGVEIDVLDAVVPKKTFEELACWQCESALREAHGHRNLVLTLLHGVWVPGSGSPTVHLLFTDEPAVEEGQQILGLRL